MRVTENYSVILIDDNCLLCNHLIRWLIRRDKKDVFRFAGLESAVGKELLLSINRHHVAPESMILIRENQVFENSDAAWRILIELNRLKWLGFSLRIIPAFIRNSAYKIIATNRFRFFGTSRSCSLDEDYRKKIIH